MIFSSNLVLEHWITELNFTELFYLLCRELEEEDFEKSLKKIKKLFYISPIKDLNEIAGRIKCKMSISLSDSYNLALATKLNCKALFKHEKELTDELEKDSPFTKQIVFIDDFPYFRNKTNK